jgi:DNA repair photolyase
MEKKTVFGTKEWAAGTVNITNGCEHDCRYCYAKASAIEKKLSTIDSWKNPVQRKRIGKIPVNAGTIMFPSQHDIFESNLKESMETIHKIIGNGNFVLIVSKPHYECILSICNEFQTEKDKILFRFTIGSADNEVLKYWEPNAPNFNERHMSLIHAFTAGYNTSISCEPMLDNNIHAVIKQTREYVTDAIWLGKGNFMLKRMHTNGNNSVEDTNKTTQLMSWHNDINIMKLYEQYKDDPIIKWKESIKKVVGLEIPTEAGLDI